MTKAAKRIDRNQRGINTSPLQYTGVGSGQLNRNHCGPELPAGSGSETGDQLISSCRAGRTSGRLHVEKHMFDVARLVEAHQALGVGFDLVF